MVAVVCQQGGAASLIGVYEDTAFECKIKISETTTYCIEISGKKSAGQFERILGCRAGT